MDSEGQVRRQIGLVVALIAIGLLGFWTRLQFQAIAGGTEEYGTWASKHYLGGITSFYISHGEVLWGSERPWGERSQEASYVDLAYPPGYSFFLGALRRIGIADLQAQRTVQAFLDCFSVLAVYLLARWCAVPAWVGLVGVLGYALYPMWAVGSTFLLAECFTPAFVLWILVLLVWAVRWNQAPAWVPGGLVIGVASMFRPDLSLLICPACLWAAWQTSGWYRARALACLVLGFGLIIGPWAWHNHRSHGIWMFTTTGGSASVWEGLGEVPNDYGFILDDGKLAQMLREKGMFRFSPEADRYLKNEYFRAWAEHPGFVLKTIEERMNRILFEAKELWGPSKLLLCHLQNYAGSWTGMACLLLALVLMRRNPAALLVVALPLVYALMSIGLVHYEPRYVRYTHLSFLFALMTTLAVVWTWGQPRWPRLAVILQTGLLVVLCIFAVKDLHILGRASYAVRTTAAAMSKGHPAEGLNVLQAAYLSQAKGGNRLKGSG